MRTWYVKACFLLAVGGCAQALAAAQVPDLSDWPKAKGTGRSNGTAAELKGYRRVFILAVGVAEYKRAEENLDWPVKDAREFLDVLQTRYRFAECRGKVLANPTRTQLEDELRALGDSDLVGPNDAVIVFYSGHALEADVDGEKLGFLLPADADIPLTEANVAKLNRWAVPMTRVWEYLAPSPAKHVTIFADACAAGNLIHGKGSLPVAFADNFSRRGREAFMAVGASQTTVESSSLKNGVFSHALIDELKAKAAQGQVFLVDDLNPGIRRRVTEEDARLRVQNAPLPEYGSYIGSKGGKLMLVPLGSNLGSIPLTPTDVLPRTKSYKEVEGDFLDGRWKEAGGLLEAAADSGNSRARVLRCRMDWTRARAAGNRDAKRLILETLKPLAEVDLMARHTLGMFQLESGDLDPANPLNGAKNLLQSMKEIRNKAGAEGDAVDSLCAAESYLAPLRGEWPKDLPPDMPAESGVPIGANRLDMIAKFCGKAAAAGNLLCLYAFADALALKRDERARTEVIASIRENLRGRAEAGDSTAFYANCALLPTNEATALLEARFSKLDSSYSFAVACDLMTLSADGNSPASVLGACERSESSAKEGDWIGGSVFLPSLARSPGPLMRRYEALPTPNDSPVVRYEPLAPTPLAIHWFELAASRGHTAAMVKLGLASELGQGVPMDYAQAKIWFEKAAALGEGEGHCELGNLYMTGRGVSWDQMKAREYFEKGYALGAKHGADYLAYFYQCASPRLQDPGKAIQYREIAIRQGDTASMVVQGVRLASGIGISKDVARARDLFVTAISRGDPDGTYGMGQILRRGDAGRVDTEKAIEWLKKGASMDSAASMILLGTMYESGQIGGIPSDTQATEWFRRAADLGSDWAMELLGDLCEATAKSSTSKEMGDQAVHWWTQAALCGNTDAMNSLGDHLKSSDPEKSKEWYEKSAGREDPDGILGLANYWSILAPKKDSKKGFELYLRAANWGSAPAMESVGFCYENGDGVRKDLSEARHWYLKGADAGDAWSMYHASVLLAFGRGGSADITLAASWLQKAAECGHRGARIDLASLYFSGRAYFVDDAMLVADPLNPSEVWKAPVVDFASQFPANYEKARALYVQSQLYSQAAALLEMGGPGLSKDEAEGFKLRVKAAENELYGSECAELVADRFETGTRGAPKDAAKAVAWWKIAKTRHSLKADEAIKRLGG